MSILPVCDLCHQPKESTRHWSLYRQWRKWEEEKEGSRYGGNIDICDDCRARTTHEGRNSAHKQRLEFGKVSR